jgi:chorismate mutase
MVQSLRVSATRLASGELVLDLQSMSDPMHPSAEPDAVLASFRRSIDNIDAALIHILAERFRITQAVGEFKARATLPPADPEREAKQIARLRKLSEEADLDPEFSEKFLRFIIEEVIRHHEKARSG